ncbi:extracellular solute-binding protein [Siminovitchia acidinfaciens]|uniref:Extracellular solute-binding protein n=1 Tax=Siminovitchia acidinfaciens TaxID=2321395 RepID=A0A429Y7D0_9BACI|nr:ABC transporter substrate-binding protein [Siminovitchia acidinfaciens]RST77288.1 extracellular solute-binding protein [Siminovitchia acidinfaciens]
MLKRVFMAGAMVVVISMIAACGNSEKSSGGKEKAKTLVIADWGGAITEAREDSIFEPFEKEFGVKIQVETPTDYGKYKAMVEGGNVSWDVANVGSMWAAQAIEQDMFEPIDYDVVSKEGVFPNMAREFYVGAEMYSTAISYNTEAFPNGSHPKTWEEFWDTDKFPGARALSNRPYDTIEVALLADGVKPEDLYPLDIDRAFKSLDKLKSKTDVIWWEAGAQPAEMLSSGTVAASSAWSGRITAAKNDGAPVDIEYNQALLNSEAWSIPKGSKNKELAMEFINFATRAEPQAAFAENIDYSPINEEAIEMLPDEVKQRLGQSPEMAEKQIPVNEEYWAENFEEVNQRFQEWMLQ